MDIVTTDKHGDQPICQDSPATDRQSFKRSREHCEEYPRLATRRPAYRRYAKPPYTYLGMTVVAIHTSPNRRLTLAGIQDALSEMFQFFRGEYKGWRDSVRHNLSANKCFIRIPRNDCKNAKGCFWTVDLSLVPANAFKRTSCKDLELQWASNLIDHLGIQNIILSSQQQEKTKETPQQQNPSERQSFRRPYTSFSIDSILGSADTKPLTISEPPDTKYNHPYSFLGYQNSLSYQMCEHQYPPYAAMLYQTVTAPHLTQPDVSSSLCPVPSYGETTPFSTLFPQQHLPNSSHFPLTADLSTRRQQEDKLQSPAANLQIDSSLSQNLHHRGTEYTSYPEGYHDHQQMALPRTQPTPLIYRPFEAESSSFFHRRLQPSHHHHSTETSSLYDSDNSSEISQPQIAQMTYMPPTYHPVYSSDSNDTCMSPPSLPSSLQYRFQSWNNYPSDANSYSTSTNSFSPSASNYSTSAISYSTSASLTAAVDDFALFSDTGSSSSRHFKNDSRLPDDIITTDSSITSPLMSDSSALSEVIQQTRDVFSDVITSSCGSIPDDVIDVYHFGQALPSIIRSNTGQ